jgi:hypothetical protein
MRKMTLMKVVELRKDYEGKTKCLLGNDGYVSSEGISRTSAYHEGRGLDGFCVECDDTEAPELGQTLVVMVETVPAELGKRMWNDAGGDHYKTYLDKRRAEVTSPQPATKPVITSGRRFR